MEKPLIERRIKLASVLVGAGLVVQFFSLTALHPLAFVAFLALGCPLVGAGILVFLFGLARAESGA